MRAREFINNEVNLVFHIESAKNTQLKEYFIARSKIYNFNENQYTYFPSKAANNFRGPSRINLSETQEYQEIESFIQSILQLDYKNKIKKGDTFSVLSFEIMFAYREILLSGFTRPKTVVDIKLKPDNTINYILFDDGDRYPRQSPIVDDQNKPVSYSAYFKDAGEATQALTMLSLQVPNNWELIKDGMDVSLNEGGWDTEITQGTVVKPAVVKAALAQIQKFTAAFNQWLAPQGLGPVQIGHPTGSSAYYEVDPEDKIYGDIDLQMIGPSTEHKTHSQFQGYWNKLADDFVNATRPAYIYTDEEGQPGHPIVQIGPDQYVQVDFMWHEEKTREWGRFRATPERGIKGLLNGNMFSVLGDLLNMSIQHAGVQLKIQAGKPVSFRTQKNTEVITVSTDPKTFVYDILTYLHGGTPKVDPLLKQYPGVTTDNVKIASLVNAVKGLANSFALNNMYGHGILAHYHSAEEFLNAFWNRYQEKAIAETESAKRDKATTPEAIARAEDDKKKVLQGLATVKGLFEQ